MGGVVYGTRSTSAYTTLAAGLRGNHGILCWNPLCRLICSSAVCLALTVPLLANSREPLHEHSLDRVVVYLTALDFQIDPEGKQPEHSVLPAGSLAWGVPARHTEHNLSDQTFEAIVIEPKY